VHARRTAGHRERDEIHHHLAVLFEHRVILDVLLLSLEVLHVAVGQPAKNANLEIANALEMQIEALPIRHR